MYGNAPSGQRCIEIIKKTECPNLTLNMLILVNGVEYYNILDGYNTVLEFLWEASQAADAVTRRPALEVGDIVVWITWQCIIMKESTFWERC